MAPKAPDTPPPGASGASEIAWPARMVSGVLGPPTKACAAPNSRLRFRACQKCADSIGVVNVIANTFLMIVKGYLGVVGGSTALVADAIHSAADLISSIMLLIGLRVSSRPADQRYPYGYGKVEFLVAVIIYTSLISAGVVIFIDAMYCIVNRSAVSPSVVTIWGAILSVVVNEMMFRQSVCAGVQLASPSIVANAWEKRSDALSSVAVLAGIIGAKLGFHFLDPAAAILVAFYIVKLSVENLVVAYKGLMDRALEPEVVANVQKAATGVDGVRGIRTLRTREIGQNVWIDIDVLVGGDLELGVVARIKEEVKQAIAKVFNRPAHIVVYPKPARD